MCQGMAYFQSTQFPLVQISQIPTSMLLPFT